MSSYQTLDVGRDGPVLHIRLNRPDVRNAFNGTLVEELQLAFREADQDEDARVVVLSGNGKSFSAGADLSWMQQQAALTPEDNERGAERMARMFLSIARCRKPVVGRMHGHALGGGTGLTAAVDMAFCSEDCLFGLTEVKLGIVPAVISPFVMAKIGRSAARELFLTGRRFTAQHALDIGLVHTVVAPEALDATVDGVLREVASAGPQAIAAVKSLIADVWNAAPSDAPALTAAVLAERRASAEGQEGLRAFLEKRKPGWSRA